MGEMFDEIFTIDYVYPWHPSGLYRHPWIGWRVPDPNSDAAWVVNADLIIGDMTGLDFKCCETHPYPYHGVLKCFLEHRSRKYGRERTRPGDLKWYFLTEEYEFKPEARLPLPETMEGERGI